MSVAKSLRKALPESVKIPLRRCRRWLRNHASRQPPLTLKIGSFGGFEVAYRGNSTDIKVIKQSFENESFFSHVPEYRSASDHVIIDVGAHIGTFALVASKTVPAGRVYAIEACEESCNLIRINVALNKLSNVDVTHLALSDRKGTCTLYYDSGNWGHSIMAQLSSHGEEVTTDTLGAFMDAKGIAHCDYIKFNCEGAEFPILLSSSSQVLSRIDTMVILFHGDLSKGHSETELCAHLQQCGFETTVRKRSPERGWMIATRRND
jgi:FkbM family methyltransferase